MNIDINFYKNYDDLKNMSNNQLLIHWNKYGSKENRLSSKRAFYNKYPNFNWRIYINNYSDLKISIDNEFQAIIHYWHYGSKENREYNQILETNENIFSKKKIYQVYVSESLNHFKDRLIKKYNLCEYISNTKACLFFGIYNLDDLYKILKHNGDVFIMFGGSDIEYLIKTKQISEIKKINPKQIFSISDNISRRLNELNIDNLKVEFNLVDTTIFKKVNKTGNNIYIYNGFTKGNEENYGEELYKQVVDLLPEFNYIYSNELNVLHSKMPEIYQKCFIGLRLTKNDGNANTVQELKEMGIPVIHNGDEGGIIWNNLDDILRIIKEQYELKKFKEESFEYTNKKENNINCYYQENIHNDNLEIIYENINTNIEFIKKFKNILFISSDFPGYGGAATNCHKMANFLSKTNNVQEIYYIFDNDNITTDNFNIIYEKDLEKTLKNLKKKPDLIILRNFVRINLKKIFNCPIIFCIPGIFYDTLDKYWYELNDIKIINKYINKNVLEQIKNSDISFCNSSHTKDLLKKYFNIDTFLFYFGFIPYLNIYLSNKMEKKKFKFKYGLICSNFNRKIKNIHATLEKYKKEGKKLLLIGMNSKEIAKKYKFEYKELLDNSLLNDILKDIEFIINNSYFESCSNIMLEHIFINKYNNKNFNSNINNKEIINKPEIKINNDNLNLKLKKSDIKISVKNKILELLKTTNIDENEEKHIMKILDNHINVSDNLKSDNLKNIFDNETTNIFKEYTSKEDKEIQDFSDAYENLSEKQFNFDNLNDKNKDIRKKMKELVKKRRHEINLKKIEKNQKQNNINQTNDIQTDIKKHIQESLKDLINHYLKETIKDTLKTTLDNGLKNLQNINNIYTEKTNNETYNNSTNENEEINNNLSIENETTNNYNFTNIYDNEKIQEIRNTMKKFIITKYNKNTDNITNTNIKNYVIENKSNLKILLISTQYTNYGGAATLAYEFHKKLLENNYDSYALFLNPREFKEKIYNPDSLKNTYLEILNENYNDKLNDYYQEFKNKLGIIPDLVIGFNYIAPIIGKILYPQSLVYYYITGCKYISFNNITAQSYINEKTRDLNEVDEVELFCINKVDFVIPNSYLTKNIFLKLYPNISHKLTNVIILEELFFTNKEEFSNTNKEDEKEYDITVISSRFDREVKNIDFIQNLFGHESLEKYKKTCIGKFSSNITNANVHLGFLNTENLTKALRKSKLVLITSNYESFSLSQTQGICNNCIVLSNSNVGAGFYLDKYYILNDFSIDKWVEKIKTILDNHDYHQKIFKPKIPEFNTSKTINNLLKYTEDIKTNNLIRKKNVIWVSVDKPFDGGSATNVMNSLNIYRNSEYINPIGIFLVNNFDGLDLLDYEEKGIYFVTFDKNIEINMNDLIKKIEKKYNGIDLFFVKNYKVCVCILKFISPNKIIFSPSGLRFISSITDYYHNLDLSNMKNYNSFNDFDESLDLYDFVSKYDLVLEKYVFIKMKYILPNSEVTYNAIKTLYNLTENLLPYINITYIDFDKDTIDNSQEKIYDLAFVSYSWKRKVKNYQFIKKLITSDALSRYKILIIGKDQDKSIQKENITNYDNLSNEDINNILKRVKVFCSNSLYDSSPNVIKEALQNGCKIITTKNIGNANLFNEYYIINEPDNQEEWINKIHNILDKYNNINEVPLFKNTYGYEKVYKMLENLILSIINNNTKQIINNNDNIGIYRLVANWDLDDNILKMNNYEDLEIEYKSIFDLSINECEKLDVDYNYFIKHAENLYNYDLFLQYFLEKFDGNSYNSNKNYHYITMTNLDLDYPLYLNLKYLKPFIKDNMYIWFLNKVEQLNLFKNKGKYFCRGNYYNIYKNIIGDKYSEIYPATSLIYTKEFNLDIGKKVDYRFNKILVEEDNFNLLKEKYHKSQLIKFLKEPNSSFLNLNIERDNDFIFVCTENQPTKNRNLFVDFVKYCDDNNLKNSFINIGKHNDYYSKLDNLSNVKYESFDFVDPELLVKLYNRSKINLLFSGRDALPRVIIESICCGCYNIALDTLTDGKFFYIEPFGKILSFPDLEKNYEKIGKSISYKSNDIIYKTILEYLNNNFNHNNISYEFRQYIKNYNNLIT